MVRAVRGVEQGLSPGVDMVAVQDGLTQREPELGAARLARHDDLEALPRSVSPSSRAWVDLPAPSPPSNATNSPSIPRRHARDC